MKEYPDPSHTIWIPLLVIVGLFVWRVLGAPDPQTKMFEVLVWWAGGSCVICTWGLWGLWRVGVVHEHNQKFIAAEYRRKIAVLRGDPLE